MIKKFQLFRLTLLEKNQRSLFANSAQTRDEYLREIFSNSWMFNRHGSPFHYVPVDNNDESKTKTNFLFGRVGRQITLPENKSPADGLVEQTRDTWKAE